MRKIIISIIIVLILTLPSYGYVKHLLVSVAPTTIEFHLIDPNNSITGYTPNGILNQIPNLIYVLGSSSYDNDSPYDTYHDIHRGNADPLLIQPGKYKLVVYGSTIPVIARIGVEVRWSDNSSWSDLNVAKRLIYPNSIWTYEFEVPIQHMGTSNRGQLTFVKTSTSADLIKDLTTAGQLGYIGNAKFVAELTKEINEIEAEKVKGKVDDGLTPAQKAKKEYTELMKEITEKYNKPESDEFIKQEAYTVLKEDLEYIINHL